MNERSEKQLELANLFFEMGMPLEVVEQISGVDSRELIKDNLRKRSIDKKKDDIYNKDR